MYRRPINLLHDSEALPNEELAPKKKTFWRIFILGALIVLSAIFIIRYYTIGSWPDQASAYDQKTLRPKNNGFFRSIKNFIFNSDSVLEGQRDDRINILLLGIGGPGHDGPYLTDTNIILSIKPSTKEVALISIPRDLGVKIPGHDWRKINSADAFGEAASAGEGGEFARKIFAETFGLDIPYYIRVDFKAFQELIDGVGGVTVKIPRTFTDQSFPGASSTFITIHFDAGIEMLNGKRALEFSRSRHGDNGEGSDFARAYRQQLVLTALKEKLLSFGTYINPLVIQKILQSLNNHITANLDFGQIMYLAALGHDMSGITKTLVLDNNPNGYLVSTTGESGAFILSPKTGNFNEINAAIKDIFSAAVTGSGELATSTSPTNYVPPPLAVSSGVAVEIQNGTWRVGLASRLKQRLEEKGFSIIGIGNSLKRPIATTTVYLVNPTADKKVVDDLKNELRAAVAPALTDWLAQTYDDPKTVDDESGMKYNRDADILVILGSDIKE